MTKTFNKCWYTGWELNKEGNLLFRESQEHLVAHSWGIEPFWKDKTSHVVFASSSINHFVGDVPLFFKIEVKKVLNGTKKPENQNELENIKTQIMDLKKKFDIHEMSFTYIEGVAPWFLKPSKKMIELAKKEIILLSEYIDLKKLQNAYRMGYFNHKHKKRREPGMVKYLEKEHPKSDEIPPLANRKKPNYENRIVSTINNALEKGDEKDISYIITDLLHANTSRAGAILSNICRDIDLLKSFLKHPYCGYILKKTQHMSPHAKLIISEICRRNENFSFKNSI